MTYHLSQGQLPLSSRECDQRVTAVDESQIPADFKYQAQALNSRVFFSKRGR